MKKLILLLVLTCLFFNGFAQVKFGLKAGVNIPSLTGDDVDGEDFDNKIGFYGGATALIPVSEQFGVQPELLFSQKGYSFSELGGETDVKFGYLAVPVLARYTTSSGFFAETGPELAFLLSAKLDNPVTGNEDDIKDSFKSTAFSWTVGIGYTLKQGLGFNARYGFGLNSISENSNIDAKFNVLRAGLSWTFNGEAKMEKK